MEYSQYDELKRMQTVHWWFKGKSYIVSKMYEKYCRKNRDNRSDKILDIGCGMGLTLESLGKYGEIFGSDVENEAVEYCRIGFEKNYAESHINVGSLPYNIPFQETFDAVVALDVIEHVEDDNAALTEIYKIINENGHLLLTVPALMCMWSGNDELNHHYRRYTKDELEGKIKKAGFEIEKISYYNSFLFVPAFLVRKIKNLLHIKSSDVAINAKDSWINRILTYIFKSEGKWLDKHNFIIGVSLICVARKCQN